MRTAILPQLAQTLPTEKLPKYITDDNYWLEQKADGKRVMIWLNEGKVHPLQRQGRATSVPGSIVKALEPLSNVATFCLDGELVGDTLWVFDLAFAGADFNTPMLTESDPYSSRRTVLDGLEAHLESDYVRILPSARTAEEKVALSKRVIEGKGEGLMLKEINTAYFSGKRHRGLLKVKFVKDVDCVITGFGIGVSSNGSGQPKQNCELSLYNSEGKLVPVAECIIHTAVRNVVDIGSVVTARYLYCVDPAKPRLVQPTGLIARTDKAAEECTIDDQLQFTSKEIWTDWLESA